jgi:outer membrane lipoprotein SlyB
MDNRPTLHPAIMIAAASVTALSLAGVGVLTGLLPFNHKNAELPAPQAALSAAAGSAQATPTATAPAAGNAAPPTVAVNISNTPATAHAPTRTASSSSPRPVRVSRTQEPADIDVYRYDRPPAQIRTATPVSSPSYAPAICHDCGTIESVREVTKEPEGSGIGAVAGGVLGGVLGNQVGNGRGRDLATVIGVVGGAVAGNQIEKAQKRVARYEVTVRFEDGSSRVFSQDTPPAWRSGDRVKVENGLLVSRA